MGTRWPASLGVGDRIRLHRRAWTVTGFTGGKILLVDALGECAELSPLALVSDPEAEILTTVSPDRPPGGNGLDTDSAHWWERHIVEVITGLPSGAPPDQSPRPPYDPSHTTLAQREAAKAAELAELNAAGTSARTVRRKRQHYQARGVAALTDGRTSRGAAPGSRSDPRVLYCLELALQEASRGRSAATIRCRTAALLEEHFSSQEIPVPSLSTFRRLIAHRVPSSAHDRKSRRQPALPGGRVVLDTLRLNTGAGTPDQVSVTVAIDEATRCVTAAVVHRCDTPPETALLMARLLAPRPLRVIHRGGVIGWTLTTGMEVPVIRPRCLVAERATRPGLWTLGEYARTFGIELQWRSPVVADSTVACALRPLIERHLTRVTLSAPRVPLSVLQNAVDDWVSEVWYDLPETNLSVGSPNTSPHTPATRYADLTARSGSIDLPISAEEYLALLPHVHRLAGEHGVRVHGRRYDASALDAVRHRHRPVQVHLDERDPDRTWLRRPDSTWTSLPAVAPVGRHPALATSHLSCALDRALTTRVAPELLPPADPAHRSGPRPLDTLEGWRRYLLSASPPPDLGADDSQRLAYHSRLTLPGLPLLRQVDVALRGELASKRYTSTAEGLLLIAGPPGSGKTTAILEALRHHHRAARLPAAQVLPSAYVIARPGGGTRMLLADLARFLEVPAAARKTAHALADQLSAALVACAAEVVVIDDAQHLLTPAPQASNAIEHLRYLAARSGVVLVLAAAVDDSETFGRATRVRATALDNGPTWHAILAELDEAVLLRAQPRGRLIELSGLLHTVSGGLPAAAIRLVRTAAIQAVIDGSEEITEGLLLRIAQ
ncbi:AAA family ATPase [Kitasatospora sp. NPDC052868]|uniref:AAA family ATPase n=1 Tax=Kitasatospora sp. NPDC052868 TaxID=3364060 RepID=UPI0037C573CA